jgi:TP901 family phage tail tape measure protein
MLGLNVGDVVAVLKMDSTQFNAAVLNAQQRVMQFGQKLGQMGSYLTLRATVPIVYFSTKAVKSFAAFDDAITRSAAVTRGMTSVMRKEMVNTALEISKKSILSATDLAEGYFALGQAGYSAAQSVKALPVVEDFAIASTNDLDTAIRYLSRTVEGLGMSSEDPIVMMEAMTRASNSFTFAAITTTAEIEDFAVAMTHAAAPALRLVNKSVEEGVAVLMAFARAGIVAEEAGTLLWTTVRDLQRANIKARGEWEKMGLVIYDTNGKMRNLAEIFGDLEVRFNGMSDQGKKVSLMLLGFQDRSLRGIQALMGFSAEMKMFQQEMEKGGDLTRKVAETYMKSFASRLKMTAHHIDAFRISLGWILSPILTKVNEKIKEFTNWWESLDNSVKLIIVEVSIFAAMLGPLLIVLSKMVMTVTYLSIGFNVWAASTIGLAKSLGVVSLAAAANLALFGLLIAGVYAFRAAWLKGSGQIKENIDSMVDAVKNAIEFIYDSLLGQFLVNTVYAFNEAFRIIRTNWKSFIVDIIGGIKGAISWTKTMAQAIKESWTLPTMTDFVNRVKEGVAEAGAAWAESFADQWEQNLAKVEQYSQTTFQTVQTYSKAAIVATGENLNELARAIKEQFGEDMPAVIKVFLQKVSEMNESLLKMLPTDEMMEILDTLTTIRKEAQQLGEEPGFDTWSMHLREAQNLSERFREVAVRAFDATSDALTELVTTGRTDVKALAAAILTDLLNAIIRAQMAFALQNWVLPSLGGLGKGLGDLFGGGGQAAALATAGTQVSTAITTAGTTASTALTTAGTTTAGAMTTTGTTVAAAMTTAGTAISTGIIAAGTTAAAAITAAGVGSAIGGAGGGATGAAAGAAGAKGLVFNAGEIVRMAMGGIINAATLVPMTQRRTALIGEAGPEAVMPLTRDSQGRLGVRAEQPQVNVNNQTKVVNVFDREEMLSAMQSDKGEKVIVNVLRRKGII